MTERGIYELQTWLVGMKFLPPAKQIPECFKALGFEDVPEDAEEIKARYRTLAKQMHPDAGGSADAFGDLQLSTEAALKYLQG